MKLPTANPSITSVIQEGNSEKLQLQKSQFYERIKRTMSMAENVHCSSVVEEKKEKEKASKDGLWVTLVNKCNENELCQYLKTSKKGMKCARKATSGEKGEQSEKERLARSLVVLYKGSLITARKYQQLRNHERRTLLTAKPILPYKKLMAVVNRRHQHKLSIKLEPMIKGLSRTVQSLLQLMASFYYTLIPDELSWFGLEDTFQIAVGGDSAPMQKKLQKMAFG